MKIAHIAPINFNIPEGRGGPERSCYDLNEGLAKEGVKIIFYGCKNFKVSGELRYLYPVELNSYEPFINADRFKRAQMTFYHNAYGYSFDDADLFQTHQVEWTLPLAKIKSNKISVIRLSNWITDEMIKLMKVNNAENIFFVPISKTQSEVLKNNGITNYKVIHNAIEINENTTKKDDHFLFVGRLEENKGADIAIKACLNAGKKLIVIGKPRMTNEKSKEFFEKEIKPYLNSSLITYIEEVPHREISNYYASAKAVLFPLRDPLKEAFGRVTVEAMGSGTPVYAIRNSLMEELIIHGETGLLAKDEAELTEFVKNPVLLSSSRCIQHVKDNFSPEVISRQYIDLYQSLIKA
jgi:glycosyltransferase involved in cell wall biosynthesis